MKRTEAPRLVTPQALIRRPCFGCGEKCPDACFRMAQFDMQERRAHNRSWEHRWHRGSPAEVTHPLYGSVVVPHTSKLVALENAAELWGCHWTDIKDAAVTWVPAGTPVQTPWTQPKRCRGQM